MSQAGTGWSQLRSLLGDRRGPVVALGIGSVVSGLTESGILAILAQAAAGIVAGVSRIRVDLGPVHLRERLAILLVIAIALACVRLGLQAVVSVLPARIAAELQAQLRREVFSGFMGASWAEQSRDREGHLQELMTNQSAQAAQGALQATFVVVALMSFLVLVASALALNVLAAVIVLVAAVILFELLRPLSALGGRRAQATSRASLSYAGGVSEAVRLAEETKVFGAGRAQSLRVERLIAGVQEPFFQTQLLARLVPGIYQSLIYLLVAGGLLGLYATGEAHVGALGAVVLILVRAGTYGQQAQGSYQYMRQALPFVQRVHEARDRYLASAATAGTRPLARVKGLAFDQVYFEYEPGHPVLSGITFTVSERETIGVVGPTGAGKSTLVQILLGLRSPSAGHYLVNGVPAAQFSRREWERSVAYLSQEPRLLHASVADNIRFFRDVDDADVESAAQLAGIHDDILQWPAGYQTIVGPRADAVSGGQQQRICLARALAMRPQVLVLDEPTSALDPGTEALIQQSLATLKHDVTLFVVAHRMSTLSICDRVMVIVDGQLEAFDEADALVVNSAYYRAASALSASPVPQPPLA